MEVVSEGSLQPVSRPASSEKRAKGVRRLPMGGSFEQLPPEVNTSSSELDFYDECEDNEDYDYGDDGGSGVLISQVESDVNVEDIDTDVITRQRTSNEDVFVGERGQESCNSAEDASAETLVVNKTSEDASSTQDVDEMDPKIRKGLAKIRKLDKVLSEKIQKEKEVKTKRRLLEKMWRERNQQMEKQREEEGHGKMNLGVAHILALGPPDDHTPGESDNDMSCCFSPVFPTEPLVDDSANKEAGRRSNRDQQTPSSECPTDEQKSEKMHKKKGTSKAKQKNANFIKRNIALAADAGNVIPMTEEEKKRLEELLSEDTDQFVADGSVTDICVASGTGFLPDQESVDALSVIDQKLEALVPMDELDMLSEKGTWTPIPEVELTSQTTEGDRRSLDYVDIGERVLREEKEMRDMKQRLLAIEHELQNLENSSGEDSDPKISREMLEKLISGSSRTTSRSTTISATVLSNLSTPRQYGHGEPLGDIEEAIDDNYSSRTSSRTLTASGKDTPTNILSLREYMDSPVDE